MVEELRCKLTPTRRGSVAAHRGNDIAILEFGRHDRAGVRAGSALPRISPHPGLGYSKFGGSDVWIER